MKPSFSSFEIPENGFGYFFLANIFLCRNGKRQPAENGGKIMFMWSSLYPFAFHGNVMLRLRSIDPIPK